MDRFANIKCDFCGFIFLEGDFVNGVCPACHRSRKGNLILERMQRLRDEYERLAYLQRLTSEARNKGNTSEMASYDGSIRVQRGIIEILEKEIEEICK